MTEPKTLYDRAVNLHNTYGAVASAFRPLETYRFNDRTVKVSIYLESLTQYMRNRKADIERVNTLDFDLDMKTELQSRACNAHQALNFLEAALMLIKQLELPVT